LLVFVFLDYFFGGRGYGSEKKKLRTYSGGLIHEGRRDNPLSSPCPSHRRFSLRESKISIFALFLSFSYLFFPFLSICFCDGLGVILFFSWFA